MSSTETHTRATPPLWLLALTLSSFAIGTADMVVAGILPSVAEDLSVSEAAAGQLVTVYSLTYGVGAPVMAVLVARFDRRRLLLGTSALFTLVCAATALAPGFAAMLALRVLAALCASVMGPTALAMAASFAPPQHKGRYLGMVTAGLTVSLVAGVPIGTWIGGAYGWPVTMLFVAALGLLATLGMLRLPPGARLPEQPLRARFEPLRRPTILAVSAALVIAGSGGMMPYIYLAPLFRQLTGGGAETLGVAIMAFGVAGFAGVLLGGRGADTWGPGPTLTLSVGTAIVMVAILGALGGALPAGSLPFTLFAAITIVWALGIWALSPPLQAWLLRRANGADSAILALNTSGMYLGFAIAGSLGGAVLGAWGPVALPLASATLLIAGGLVLVVAFTRLAPREDRLASAPSAALHTGTE